MAKVSLKHENEPFQSLLKRFKNAVDDSEILKDLRKYEAYESPGELRKRARSAAIKREQKRREELQWQRLGIKAQKQKKKKTKNYNDSDSKSDNIWSLSFKEMAKGQ